jgi:hypothetical protein
MMRYLKKIKEKIRINKVNISNKYNIKNEDKKLILSSNDKINSKLIFNKLKHKYITGFRLEAKGRLTKRYTASRSKHKFIYKGNLLGLDSSFKGLSSVLLRGNLKSNLEYTKSKSKTRIGSFGIKSWISGN